ncbi:MAG: metallophosphoesterase [Pseudomonadota bacterium]
MNSETIPSRTHNLKILAVSDYMDKDLKQQIEDNQFPRMDLIISCGDLDPEYLTFLRHKLACPLFYVKGNHDIRYTAANLVGCENIHGRVVSLGTLNIMGMGGSMWYNGGPNQYTEARMKKKLFWMGLRLWRKRPIHMMVTHAPPRHIHDRNDPCHMGFASFRRFIAKHRPTYFIHGHIHQEFDDFDSRVTQINTTQVINTCGHTIIEV